MKRLVAITVLASAGVLLLAFGIRSGIYVLEGKPIAHATGFARVLLRDTLTVIVLAVICIGYVAWWWVDSWSTYGENPFNWPRRK